MKWEFLATFADILCLLGAEVKKLKAAESAHASSYDYFGFAASNRIQFQPVSNVEGCAYQCGKAALADFHAYAGRCSATGNAQSDWRAEPVPGMPSFFGKNRCVVGLAKGCVGVLIGVHDILIHFPDIGRSAILR
jgi:hypothetical protein